MRPKCIVCKINVTSMMPSGNYRKKCRKCGSANGRATGKKAYTSVKKAYCESLTCPIPLELLFPEFIEVHHIAGKSDDENTISLCTYCHRLETVTNRDFVNVKYRELV